MNIWHDIDKKRISTKDFVVVIEISKGSNMKYELDKDTGMLELDRVLSTAMHYPTNYGLIPRTLSDDGDPLDALVLCSEVITPMTLVRCYPIGVIKMIDCGENDEKILAVPYSDPVYNSFTEVSQLPEHMFEQIRHFFSVYKALENKETSVEKVKGKPEAVRVIDDAIVAYEEKFRNVSRETI